MTARFYTSFNANKQSSNCCCAAAASCARILDRLDTALVLAVSICALCLLSLRISVL